VRRHTPTLRAAILAAIEDGLAEVCTGMPARVESYDAATQTCSAQPLVQRVFYDETGARRAERLPVVTDVPVEFPGAGEWRLTFPIAAGDTVWLEFSQVSLDAWLARGGEVDPEDPRHHALSDAVAYPGVRDRAHALSGVSTTNMVLGNGTTQIQITGSEVHAGGSGSVALKSTLDQFMTVLGAVVDPSGACAALHTALVTAGWPAGFVSSVLKGA
jgi:hypothetical protein